MRDDVFIDTNILVYATDGSDARGLTAMAVLAEGGVVSVQVFNEFVSVMRRLRWSWPDIRATLTEFRRFCRPPVPLTVETHEASIRIAESTGYHIFDCLLVASALEAGCTTFLSEDMQHGRVIEERLSIVNPFTS